MQGRDVPIDINEHSGEDQKQSDDKYLLHSDDWFDEQIALHLGSKDDDIDGRQIFDRVAVFKLNIVSHMDVLVSPTILKNGHRFFQPEAVSQSNTTMVITTAPANIPIQEIKKRRLEENDEEQANSHKISRSISSI